MALASLLLEEAIHGENDRVLIARIYFSREIIAKREDAFAFAKVFM